MFDDEKELRNRLVEEGTLSYRYIDKPLSIRFLQNGKYTKIPYGFLYQDDIEYIMEPTRLIKLIVDRYHQNDFVFLKKLGNYFSQTHGCKTTSCEVARLAEASSFSNSRHIGFEERDRNGDMIVARMIKLLILQHKEYSNGYIEYENKVNYRNLHEFIKNYDMKHNIEEKINEDEIKTTDVASDVECKNEEIKQNNNSKVRKKTKYNLDGQMSFEI